jgi:hypothetical protein
MPVTTIEAVTKPALAGELLGAALDSPRTGDNSDTYIIEVRGWALGRLAPVKSVQVLDGQRLLLDVPLNVSRTDVASKYPEEAAGAMTGFHVLVKTLEVSPRFELTVRVKLEGSNESPIAMIQGTRKTLPAQAEGRIQPLMLTTIGRSGSKWLTSLLGCHPGIVAFEPLVFEPRVATYWMTVLRGLTTPASYFRQIHTESWQQRRWWLGDGERGLPAAVDPPIVRWLGRDAIESLATICGERIQAFYEQVVAAGRRPSPRYFVEKYLLEPVVPNLISELYPGAREVILVRDFRDRLSSVLAWNEQRGDYGFGRDPSSSDDEYLIRRVLPDAEALLSRWRERADAAHLVRYEDLVVEPAATLAGVLGYLDLDADDATVEAMIKRASSEPALLDAHRTVSDPAASIGRWRRDLPDELAERCDQLLRPALEGFGYSRAAEPSSESS